MYGTDAHPQILADYNLINMKLNEHACAAYMLKTITRSVNNNARKVSSMQCNFNSYWITKFNDMGIPWIAMFFYLIYTLADTMIRLIIERMCVKSVHARQLRTLFTAMFLLNLHFTAMFLFLLNLLSSACSTHVHTIIKLDYISLHDV